MFSMLHAELKTYGSVLVMRLSLHMCQVGGVVRGVWLLCTVHTYVGSTVYAQLITITV